MTYTIMYDLHQCICKQNGHKKNLTILKKKLLLQIIIIKCIHY